MSGSITLYTNNILEDGTVTVTGSPTSGFPEERLWDRGISLFWLFTGTQVTIFEVDQGATGNVAVDFLAIESHNFNGEDLSWEYSANGAWGGEEVVAATWTQGDNNQIIKTIGSPQTKRHWRLTLTSMTNPTASEIFMGLAQTFNILYRPGPKVSELDNVTWRRTIGGPERSTKFGVVRKTRGYDMKLDNSTDLATLRTAIDDLDDYSKPFYVKDHEDEYWLARFLTPPPESWNNVTASGVAIELVEML